MVVKFKSTVLIIGANGFLGQNIAYYLEYMADVHILKYTKENDFNDLFTMIASADFIFHFAGENRNTNKESFDKNNVKLTEKVIEFIKVSGTDPILFFPSSIQAQNSTIYGLTKRTAENLLINARKIDKIKAFYYRFSNVFGQFARPNYNSVIATFCYNLTRNRKIDISDPKISLDFMFSQDIAFTLNNLIENRFKNYTEHADMKFIKKTCSLGDLAFKLQSFQLAMMQRAFPNLDDDFDAKLFFTFISYLPSKKSIFEIDDLDFKIKELQNRVNKKSINLQSGDIYQELILPLDCLFFVIQNAELSLNINNFNFECKKNKSYVIYPHKNKRIYIKIKGRKNKELIFFSLNMTLK